MTTPSATNATGGLSNIGEKSARWLSSIGIDSVAQLRRVGAVRAYVQLKREVPGVSLNLLYALVGAVQGEDWRCVRRRQRLSLLLEVDDAVAAQEHADKMTKPDAPGG